MARLSQAQIEMYARSAGMPDPVTMAAIAMAETGGNPRAHNAVPPDNSYGLWQINMIGAMGPTRRKQFGISRNEELYDPATNARAAARILSGQGVQAWSTYTSGAYKKFMPGGAAGGTGGIEQAGWEDWFGDAWDGGVDAFGSAAGGIADVASAIASIAEAIVKGTIWIAQPKNWVRVGYVMGGGVLIAMGLTIVARPVLKGTPVETVAKKATGAVKAKSQERAKATAAAKKTAESEAKKAAAAAAKKAAAPAKKTAAKKTAAPRRSSGTSRGRTDG